MPERELGLDTLQRIAGRPEEQVWYVCHPLHSTDAEIADLRSREDAVNQRWFKVNKVSDQEARKLIANGNLAQAKICLDRLRRMFPTITFIAPWITAVEAGADDSDPAQREAGLRDDCRVVRRCDGVVHTGNRVSDGMRREAEHAREVVDLTYLGWA